ncbi:LuxR family transcriptional regulator [Streptomyces sp. NTH33]|uniref:LuxR family transcriptional regulator n=1 Tax=Streptomyces sp. NTH33 TaxID=1735453 RepID=UPI000DA770BE|nr:LuxR family transcriptional regulator [Streptomyces sp. NTH33]PZH00276.1 LuxR family transcriptional regulator [Streptomyces sp. NTH33]
MNIPNDHASTLHHVARTLHELADTVSNQADQAEADCSGCGCAKAPAGITYIQGIPEIQATIQRAVDRSTSEILTAQPEGPRPEAVLQDALSGVRGRIAAGVSMRTLYQHSTRFDEPTKEYVRAVTGYGVQVRTLAEFFDRVIIVDRKLAFIPGNADRTTAVLVTEPAIVRFLVDIFERAWDRAEPHPFLPVRAAEAATDIMPAMRDAICKLLTEGKSDREIARRLGFSLRSLQSHVARLKDQYGAQHRLQLGYLMAIEEAQAAAKPKENNGESGEPLRDLAGEFTGI